MPFELDEKKVFITASIGIAAGEGYNRAEDIVRDADIAMYKAKFSGRGCHMIFDDAMRTDVLSYLELETDLRHAINNRDLMIYYQPIMYVWKQTEYSGLRLSCAGIMKNAGLFLLRTLFLWQKRQD